MAFPHRCRDMLSLPYSQQSNTQSLHIDPSRSRHRTRSAHRWLFSWNDTKQKQRVLVPGDQNAPEYIGIAGNVPVKLNNMTVLTDLSFSGDPLK